MLFKYTKAEYKAQQVLKDCGIVNPADVSLKIVIMSRGAFYEETSLKGKEGEIVSVGSRSFIAVNSDILFESKKRFVAAHELGHYELMHNSLEPIISDKEEDFLKWYKGGEHEIEANEFAAEFLMPTEIFHAECSKYKFSPQVIDFLSEKFKVSKTSTLLRFVKRGNHPVFLVYCKDNKMKWFKRSDDFRYYCDFHVDSPPPTGSVAYELFKNNIRYTGEERAQEVWKSDWFTMRETEQDSTFYEYCLFVKEYGYSLSLIWEK